MLFEDILIIALVASSFFLIVLPIYRFLNSVIPKKRDPIKEAKIRLDVAASELEAAKLNKQTEKLYEELYDEVLQDSKMNKK